MSFNRNKTRKELSEIDLYAMNNFWMNIFIITCIYWDSTEILRPIKYCKKILSEMKDGTALLDHCL